MNSSLVTEVSYIARLRTQRWPRLSEQIIRVDKWSDETFAASRLSMMRIMAMRTKATTVVA
jgi:hypothetical protein